MADHRFDFPTVAASTASLVFTRGARLVEDTPELIPNQEIGRTKGGTSMARSYGAAKRIWPVTAIFAISSGSEADFADVLAWIEDVAEGAVNEFEWTDENSIVRTVRLVNESFSFPKHGHDSQRCTFRLEEQ